MRKQTLAATTAVLLGAGALTFGLPATAAHADAWKPMTDLPFPAGTVSDVEVVSTGPGDAVAAAIIDGAVHAYTAVNGVWTGQDQVRSDVNATGLVLAANDSGDAVVGWEEEVDGDNRLRVSRRVNPTLWSGLHFLTATGVDVGSADLGMTGDGRMIAVASVDGGMVNDQVIVREWPKGGTPVAPEVLSSEAFNPSLDVNAKGEALVAYHYDGLVDDVMSVHRRDTAGDWDYLGGTSNSGAIASQSDVAISENGHGRVVYSTAVNAFYVAEASRVTPDGVVSDAELIAPVDEFAADPSVDINATGSTVFAWNAHKDGTNWIRYASASHAADPASSFKLTGTTPDALDPTARISDNGIRVIQHSGNGQIVTHHQAGVALWSSTSNSPGFVSDDGLDVDAEGNAVMVGFKLGDGAFGRFLDTAGPALSMSALPTTTLAKTIAVGWSKSDSLSPLKPGTDVYATSAAWNQAAHAGSKVVADDVLGAGTVLAAVPGTSYCFQLLAADTANNSSTTAKRCTAVPLDDRALKGKGWKRVTPSGHYLGTATRTKKLGKTLKVKGVQAKSLSLVVTRTKKSGKVKVWFGGKVLRTVRLKGKGKQVVIPLASFGSVRAGTLKVKTVGKRAKRVQIDGVVVSK